MYILKCFFKRAGFFVSSKGILPKKKKTPQNQIKFSDTMSIKLAVQTIREL